MKRLAEKVVIITDATNAIGAETARLFVSEGATVIVGGRTQERCRSVAKELGASAIPFMMDARAESELRDAVDLTMARFGRLDCMFNNAESAHIHGNIEETSTSALDECIAVLFRSVVLATKHAARVMKPQGSGSIINNASVAAFHTGYAPHAYAACNAAVVQFTRSAATELRESGVRVNCVCPGPIPAQVFGTALERATKQSDEIAARLQSGFTTSRPVRDAGQCLDVAHATLWLASNESLFVNGHSLVVDGGISSGQSWSDYQGYVARLTAEEKEIAAIYLCLVDGYGAAADSNA